VLDDAVLVDARLVAKALPPTMALFGWTANPVR
jgi:hypothetical protein